MNNSVKTQSKDKKRSSTPMKTKKTSGPRSSGYGYMFGLPCSDLSVDQNRELVSRLIDALKTL